MWGITEPRKRVPQIVGSRRLKIRVGGLLKKEDWLDFAAKKKED